MANGHDTPEQRREDERRENYRLSVAATAIRDLARMTGDDVEAEHSEADKILCRALTALGGGDIVDAYMRVPKWYA
jgi:hypothetical protein